MISPHHSHPTNGVSDSNGGPSDSMGPSDPNGDKAGEMLESLLRYNTMDNMFATHPPFQIDGNLGMVGAVCEILLEGQIPVDWKHGEVTGLRTREGKTVDMKW
mgnify:CR=1 FL=1